MIFKLVIGAEFYLSKSDYKTLKEVILKTNKQKTTQADVLKIPRGYMVSPP